MSLLGDQDGLFETAPVHLELGAQVDITMPWGEVWRCEVDGIRREEGWPMVDVHRLDGVQSMSVGVGRCRPVLSQPPLEGL